MLSELHATIPGFYIPTLPAGALLRPALMLPRPVESIWMLVSLGGQLPAWHSAYDLMMWLVPSTHDVLD